MPPSPPPGLSYNDCFEEIVSEEKFKFIWLDVRNIKFEYNLLFSEWTMIIVLFRDILFGELRFCFEG